MILFFAIGTQLRRRWVLSRRPNASATGRCKLHRVKVGYPQDTPRYVEKRCFSHMPYKRNISLSVRSQTAKVASEWLDKNLSRFTVKLTNICSLTSKT